MMNSEFKIDTGSHTITIAHAGHHQYIGADIDPGHQGKKVTIKGYIPDVVAGVASELERCGGGMESVVASVVALLVQWARRNGTDEAYELSEAYVLSGLSAIQRARVCEAQMWTSMPPGSDDRWLWYKILIGGCVIARIRPREGGIGHEVVFTGHLVRDSEMDAVEAAIECLGVGEVLRERLGIPEPRSESTTGREWGSWGTMALSYRIFFATMLWALLWVVIIGDGRGPFQVTGVGILVIAWVLV